MQYRLHTESVARCQLADGRQTVTRSIGPGINLFAKVFGKDLVGVVHGSMVFLGQDTTIASGGREGKLFW
jgi:hypothetical protein